MEHLGLQRFLRSAGLQPAGASDLQWRRSGSGLFGEAGGPGGRRERGSLGETFWIVLVYFLIYFLVYLLFFGVFGDLGERFWREKVRKGKNRENCVHVTCFWCFLEVILGFVVAFQVFFWVFLQGERETGSSVNFVLAFTQVVFWTWVCFFGLGRLCLYHLFSREDSKPGGDSGIVRFEKETPQLVLKLQKQPFFAPHFF